MITRRDYKVLVEKLLLRFLADKYSLKNLLLF